MVQQERKMRKVGTVNVLYFETFINLTCHFYKVLTIRLNFCMMKKKKK